MDSAEKAFWALSVLIVVGLFALVASGGFVSPVNAAGANSGGAYVQQVGNPQGAALAAAGNQPSNAQLKDGVQEISLTVQGGSYMPNPIVVKKGVPVRLVADLSSVRGCASSIVIPEFNVRKSFRQGDNSVEFTPDKSGTFEFGCSMWMYTGRIVVQDDDGTVAAFAGTAPVPAGGSCGGSGGSGGCGCGG